MTRIATPPTPDKGGMVRFEARLSADEASLRMRAIAIARDAAAQSSADALVPVAESYVAGRRSEGRSGGERHPILVGLCADDLAPGGASADVTIS